MFAMNPLRKRAGTARLDGRSRAGGVLSTGKREALGRGNWDVFGSCGVALSLSGSAEGSCQADLLDLEGISQVRETAL